MSVSIGDDKVVNLRDKEMLQANAKIYITDCITNENIEYAKSFYNSCLLYIDKKFELPLNTAVNTDSEIAIRITDSISEKYRDKLNDTQLKNLLTKIKFWCTGLFSNILKDIEDNSSNIKIFIDSNLSKHEWIIIEELFKLGVSFFIVSKTTQFEAGAFNNMEKVEKFNAETSLNYKTNDSKYNNVDKLKHINEIESAIYDSSEQICLIIKGVDTKESTSNFYAKLNKLCNDKQEYKMYIKTFGPVDYKDTKALPKINLINIDYVINTAALMIKAPAEYKSTLELSFKNIMKEQLGTDSIQQVYNKSIHCICKINEILRDSALTHIIFYGKPNEKDRVILEMLNAIHKYSIIVLISDKEESIELKGIPVIELENSEKYFDIPDVCSDRIVQTVAASVETQVNKELFSGDTLGMYKPGQFLKCDTLRFRTTFEELSLWWNKDVYLRPGFESSSNFAKIPTIFKIISGVKDKLESSDKIDNITQYTSYISRIITDKTFLFRKVATLNETVKATLIEPCSVKILHRTDINKTRFENQLPFYENNKIVKDRIKTGVNYRYKFLSEDKQDIILDGIEKLINGDFIDYKIFRLTHDTFIDTVLNVLLNIHIDVLRTIQWYMYYSQSPKVIIVSADESQISIESTILLTFLSLIGFDILIFVPTCYNTIETQVTKNLIYDKHIIGESVTDIPVDNIIKGNTINKESERKKGLFSRIFH